MKNPTTVLVTRPSPGLEETVQVFTAAGFQAVPCPLLAIEPVEASTLARQQLQQVADWDVLIFPSQHAVEQAFELLPDWSIGPQTQLIAVGPRTAHRLMDSLPENAPNPVLVPEKRNSEGVIELLQGLRNTQSVALITAPEGRQQLQTWLNSATTVSRWREVFVYRRATTPVHRDCLQAARSFLQGSDTKKEERLYVLATSVSSVTALLGCWPADQLAALQEQTLVCASQRIAAAATDAGFSHCLIAEGAAPQQLLAAVRQGLGQ